MPREGFGRLRYMFYDAAFSTMDVTTLEYSRPTSMISAYLFRVELSAFDFDP